MSLSVSSPPRPMPASVRGERPITEFPPKRRSELRSDVVTTLALDLAQGRYNLGLSSIVELSQAELNLTQAEIENMSAKYDYQSVYATLQYTMGLLR
jgi:outer membrane protein TolC